MNCTSCLASPLCGGVMGWTLLAVLAGWSASSLAQQPATVDVLVYGATPSGIAAAVAAAADGCSVLLIEPTERIGGQVTRVLSHADFRSRESLGGAFADFAARVEQYYTDQYGAGSQQVRDCLGGTSAEPRVNLLVFEQMLAEYASLQVRCELRVIAVDIQPTQRSSSSSAHAAAGLGGMAIKGLTCVGPTGQTKTYTGSVIIDASYEGDVMVLAGIPSSVDPECEARRMRGMHVYSQADSEHAPGDARATLHVDSIAMADYGNNNPVADHAGPRSDGRPTSEFHNPVPPYQIPYGVLVPHQVGNLLVSGAISSSHAAFCRLRREPLWMSLGEAAGHAASLAVNIARQLQQPESVQTVPVRQLQERLHRSGAATIYVSDVLPGDSDFPAVQWWGTQGGLHGLAPMPAAANRGGENRPGRYAAIPGQAAELDKPLDDVLAKRWSALARLIGLTADRLPEISSTTTRGDFVRYVFKAAQGQGLTTAAGNVPRCHPQALPNIHPPGEVDNMELTSQVISDRSQLAGIVVDDDQATLVGQWQYSTHTPPYVGRGYLHDMREGKGQKSITFTPNLPHDGQYEVRLAHCYNVRRATNTLVTVHHADGESSLRIDQQQPPEHGRLFRTLGTFPFRAGSDGWVRISNEGTDGKYVIADAIQFLPIPSK